MSELSKLSGFDEINRPHLTEGQQRRQQMSKNQLAVPTTRLMNPFREFSKMQTDLERLFDDFFKAAPQATADFGLAPSCEIKEDSASYNLRFDIPGVKKEDIKIEFNRGVLSVSAERREEKKSEDEKTRASEIYYGSFSRSLMLPSSVDEKMIDAKYDNGVLSVKIPKVGAAETKQIPIH